MTSSVSLAPPGRGVGVGVGVGDGEALGAPEAVAEGVGPG